MAGIPLQTLVLRRLASVKHKAVAEALGTDESKVSRIASGERGINLERLEAFLRELGLVVVEVGGNAVTIPAEKYRALQVLAREALRFDVEEGE
jgi:transcriptional regulator with XRE-family HTH domain